MSRKIAVIGSNSFSGSDFIDLLLEDGQNEVAGFSRSPEKDAVFLPYKRHRKANFRFYQTDLNSDFKRLTSIFEEFKPEYIVNFAAQSEVGPSWQNPWDWFLTNNVSLSRLCDYLKDARYLKRYVHISSPEVYGTCNGIKEDAPVNPSTPYAVSKAAADFLLLAYFKNFKFPVCFVRATNVYGACQQLFKIIPRSVINVKLGKTIELHGGGIAVKSFIHVRDVSRGELAVMEKGTDGEIYHLSPEKGMRVRDAVKLICDELGADFNTAAKNVEERAGQDKIYQIDSAKARAQFSWSPKISLKEGIAGVIGWINDNWPEIQKLPLNYIHKP